MISLVIPLKNEALTLKPLLEELINIQKLCNKNMEIILIDDGSSDNTWQEIQKLDVSPLSIKALRFSRNFGKEAAIYAGLSEATGNPVIVMDGDGQHPPSLLPEMIKKWQQGALIVEAVKSKRPPEPFWKKICTAFFYFIFKHSTGLDLRTATDFKLLDRKVVQAYLNLPERNRFFRGLIKWFNFPSQTIPFEPQPRAEGISSWSFKKLVSFAWSSIISFSVWPLRTLMLMGIIGIIGSIGLLLQTLYIKIFGSAAPGFSTVIILQALLGSAILLGMGLIGEYLSRIYEEVKGRPLYVILEQLEK